MTRKQAMLKLRRHNSSLGRKQGAGSSDPARVLQKADLARDRRDWPGAVAGYSEFLDARPRDAGIWVQLGNCAKEAGQFGRSMAAYKRALELAPDQSDTYLQIGHLHKVMGEVQAALESYLKALEFPPVNLDALSELQLAGWGDDADRVLVRANASLHRSESLLVFDITDLVFYLGHHDNLSGIQRVQCCVLQAIIKDNLYDLRDVRFVSYDRTLRAFYSISYESLVALLDDLALPKSQRKVDFDVEAARNGKLFPDEPIGCFFRPGRTTMVLLGAAWVIPEYPLVIANLKRNFDARFVMLFHDFIPIYARDMCDQGTAIVFKDFVDQIIPLTDYAMCVSRSTQSDLARYCGEIGCAVPPSVVTRLGSRFDEFSEGGDKVETEVLSRSLDEILSGEPYVLFVATIEGRKNHNYIFEIWLHLLQQGAAVPRLVCVGRIGWRVDGFLRNLLETDYLGGRIEILEEVSDQALDALYANCLFTVFPSLYEGWGLPIGESLGHGKLPVIVEKSSLPEVAGEFGCVIPLDDVPLAAETIAGLLQGPDLLAAYEQVITERYQPLSWSKVAEVVIEASAAAWHGAGAEAWPRLELGAEYTIRRSKTSFDYCGEALLQGLQTSLSGPITNKIVGFDKQRTGMMARDGRWHPCEDWGTWAAGPAAGLKFALDPGVVQQGHDLIFYAALNFMPQMRGAAIDLKIGDVLLNDPHRVGSDCATMAWQIPFKLLADQGVMGEDGVLQLSITFEMSGITEAMRAQNLKVDPRTFAFGVGSFLMLDATDLERRLAIAETNLLTTARKPRARVL